MKGIYRIAWLLADYGCRALIHIIDAVAAKPKPRGE